MKWSIELEVTDPAPNVTISIEIARGRIELVFAPVSAAIDLEPSPVRAPENPDTAA